MSKLKIPEPPRHLESDLRRQITYGVPLLLSAQILSFCVLLSVFLLFLVYGVGLQRFLASRAESVSVNSQISEIKELNLPSGERVKCVVAAVVINEVQQEVLGYGENTQSAKIGDEVTIVIPTTNPKFAHLETFQSRPINVRAMLRISIMFWFPSVLLAIISLRRSLRRLNLLSEGREIEGHIVRSLPLPRPLKDHVLARWQYQCEAGTKRHFWSLQKSALTDPVLLGYGARAGLLERLLPDYKVEQGELSHTSTLPKAYLTLNILLLLGQTLLLLALAMT